MRISQLFGQTLREAPGEARTPGYGFLLRAGFVRAVGPGSFGFLPLGMQARRRIEESLCRELATLGGQPVALPTARPAESVSQAAGLAGQPGPGIPFRDRAERAWVWEPAHAAALAAAAVGVVQSYRQLPRLLYEAWQAADDGERAMGGLLGAREGRVVDVYGLHADAADLALGCEHLRAAVSALLGRCGVEAVDVIVAADGAGAAVARAWLLPHPDGGTAWLRCPACGYAAEQSAARLWRAVPAEAPLPLQDVATPDCKTIADLAAFLGIPAARTAKAVFLVAGFAQGADRFIFAVVRGDTALNEAKLLAALGASALRPATEAEIREAGAEPGYGSPVGLAGITIVVDALAAASPNLVAGANRAGYHLRNVNHGRDYRATQVVDIAAAQDGSPCPACGAALGLEHGVAVASVAQAGDSHARAAGATYLDRDGRGQPILLGWGRVWIDRLLAAVAEAHCDAHGLIWPAAVAPYDVYLMTLGKASPETAAAAERIDAELAGAGCAVLFDDRDERAGVKFNDADLIGAPLRVALGERGLQNGVVEVKRRAGPEVQPVALGQLAAFVLDALAGV